MVDWLTGPVYADRQRDRSGLQRPASRITKGFHLLIVSLLDGQPAKR